MRERLIELVKSVGLMRESSTVHLLVAAAVAAVSYIRLSLFSTMQHQQQQQRTWIVVVLALVCLGCGSVRADPPYDCQYTPPQGQKWEKVRERDRLAFLVLRN